MPLQATSGAASYDAFGGGAVAAIPYIEDVFSTYLYDGTGVAQTITNGIDVSTKGGLVWIKARNVAGEPHVLVDSARGATRALRTSGTDAEVNDANRVSAFTTSGFTVGTDGETNGTSKTYASWTWRKQPKYFDVVTWTGSGANRTISHSLGSVPACIIVKRTDTTGAWQVYHRSLANTEYLVLNTTAAKATGTTRWNSTTPTSTVFSLGTDATVNASGGTYVAYIFAHDAGGFGLTGTDNVISCGSYTGNGVVAGPSVTLGYEPQWVLVKSSTVAGAHWYLMDTMRGMAHTVCNELYANLTAEETAQSKTIIPTATGFDVATNDAYINNNGSTYIYIAIRRGPMKVPTSGTSVFNAISRSGTGATVSVTGTGFAPDAIITKVRNFNGAPAFWDKLRGPNRALTSNTPDVEETTTTEISSFDQDGFSAGTSSTFYTNASGGYTYINWQLKRAPSFFDEVCYTGTGSATTFSHNLQAVPELMICKKRNTSASWIVYSAPTGNSAILELDSTGAVQTGVTNWNNTTPTSSVFSVGTQGSVNSGNHVMYLFATCAGVSKVGSYTGNGSTQTIDCGFGAGGARFVLIKRTDTTGDWYVYDTIRGMTTLTDPYLRLNSSGSEVATLGSVTTVSTGFALNSTILAAINVSAGSYIFLAIA